MIKGINKRIIEVRSLKSDRFERAIFFVRDEYSEDEPSALKKRAERFLLTEFGIAASHRTFRIAALLLGFILSALSGAAITMLIR